MLEMKHLLLICLLMLLTASLLAAVATPAFAAGMSGSASGSFDYVTSSGRSGAVQFSARDWGESVPPGGTAGFFRLTEGGNLCEGVVTSSVIMGDRAWLWVTTDSPGWLPRFYFAVDEGTGLAEVSFFEEFLQITNGNVRVNDL